MADQTLLSDLCGICNTTKSKYRCPGCATRTCSLPCYKRHQQWAQCSGKRDPTQYVKKSQLATPAGIDHDYNYLTSIERDLGRADREVNDRLLGTQRRPQPNSWNKTLFDKRVTADRVHIIRAPIGLSRQRDNNSRLNKKRTSIIWSVEWIHQDKTRLLSEIQEHASLEEAYRIALESQSDRGKKKRKRQTEESHTVSARSEDDSSLLLDQSQVGLTALGEEAKLPSQRGQSTSESTGSRGSGLQGKAYQKMADDAHASPHIYEPEPQPIPAEYHFFLLRPQTNSSRHVLIPLHPSSSLNHCLQSRTILEFPTIYVFASLPPPKKDFVLEQDYLNDAVTEEKELDDILGANPDIVRKIQDNEGIERHIEDLDPQRILDVLRQDLGGTRNG